MSRPEPAVDAALADLAAAFDLESIRHAPRIALDLAVAAAQTRLAREFYDSGIYDTDTVLSWCDAGRAYLRTVIGPEPAETEPEHG